MNDQATIVVDVHAGWQLGLSRASDPGWLDEKLWPRVDKTGSCWIWTGGLVRGYGQIYLGLTSTRQSATWYTHRLAWLANGSRLDRGMVLDHLCRNPPCCNPAHLEQVTQHENMRRAFATQTHCKYGHEFTPQNVIPSGPYRTARTCRVCYKAAQKRTRERRKLRSA